MKKKHIVAGQGQIGAAIKKILGAEGIDTDVSKNDCNQNAYEILHICFPYSALFLKQVRSYQKQFSPKITIIHSTVPVGTSSKLSAVHSPIRGVHPFLEKGIRTFVKFFGGPQAKTASKYFTQKGISVICHTSARTTEALKLWDTTVYGWNIILEKIVHDFCKKNKVDFDLVYTKSNSTYNEGYEKLGYPQYKKYILKHVDGGIGGHCVISNLDLLDNKIAKIIKQLNKAHLW